MLGAGEEVGRQECSKRSTSLAMRLRTRRRTEAAQEAETKTMSIQSEIRRRYLKSNKRRMRKPLPESIWFYVDALGNLIGSEFESKPTPVPRLTICEYRLKPRKKVRKNEKC